MGATAASSGRLPATTPAPTPTSAARETSPVGNASCLSPRIMTRRSLATMAASRALNGAHQSSVSKRSRMVAASTRSATAERSSGRRVASATSACSGRSAASRAVLRRSRSSPARASSLAFSSAAAAPPPRDKAPACRPAPAAAIAHIARPIVALPRALTAV